VIKPIRLSDLQKIYENETAEEREARYEANRQRTEKWLQSWKEFAEKHPEIANNMVCAA